MVCAPQHDFCDAAYLGIFGDLHSRVVPIHGGDPRSQLFSQTHIVPQAFQVFALQIPGLGSFYKQRRESAVKGLSHAGCRADHLCVGWRTGKAGENVFPGFGGSLIFRFLGFFA